MEFFATARLVASPDQVRHRITGPRLAECCGAIDRVLDWREDLDVGEIYCLWGQFEVRREPIRDGVRFTLPGCPNALAWTVTAEPEGKGVLVHCTINRTEHEPDFIESIETFVEDWRIGLELSDVPAVESLSRPSSTSPRGSPPDDPHAAVYGDYELVPGVGPDACGSGLR